MSTAAKSRKWVRTTIVEPFPVFYSHTNQKCRRANDPATEGPFYAPGSEWFDFPEHLAFRQAAAGHLRANGYTVNVEVVER